LGELKEERADKKLRRYKSNLLRHLTRMNSCRKAKIMLKCRRLGRSLKKYLKRQKQVYQGLTGDG
jgi:hypothetical protein